QPLAERVARQAQDFVDGVGALATGEGGDETGPLLLLEESQILLAGAQPGASKDVIPPGNCEPDVVADPDLPPLRTGLGPRLGAGDAYGERFGPYADGRPARLRLSDEVATVGADLIHGLQRYKAGRSREALWWWQYSYVNHWGTHAGAALRALHAIVAHALLDVAEEVTPG